MLPTAVTQSLLRTRAIAGKEMRQLRRDRMTFGMVIMIPLIQLMLFGYAINTDVRNVSAGLVDFANNATSRQLVESIRASQIAEIQTRLASADEAQAAITRGDIKAALIIPSNLEQRLLDNREVAQWLVDGSDTMVAGAMLALRNLPLQTMLDPTLETSNTANNSAFTITLLYNPERQAAINIVPGLVGIILTMTMIMFTSAALVRERERGNLELLITTPIHPIELMIGKILPYIAVGLIQVTIVLSLGHLIFNVPFNGNLLHLFAATLLFIAASLTLGLILSTIATSQLQAMQMTVFILMPSILLSGFMFPYDAMPTPAQWLAECLPATHFIRMIRGIVLRGAELPQLVHDGIWLAGFTILGLILASLRFKKRLD